MSKAKKQKNANKHRALSAQQTIPYIAMHPDGICQLPGGLCTKTLEYEDINYAVASTEDQTAIISGWSACLNYFDSSLPFQLSFVNRRSRNANRYKVNIPAQEDDFNSIRGEYVEMLKGQIAKSNNGIERYDDIISWADMYDSASTESKKMIVSCLIRRVEVYRDYRLHIDFNIDFEQFSAGLDISAIAA